MPHHMDDAELNGSPGINSLNGLRETLEAVHAGNEDVLYAAVFQLSDDLQPEFGALGLGNP